MERFIKELEERIVSQGHEMLSKPNYNMTEIQCLGQLADIYKDLSKGFHSQSESSSYSGSRMNYHDGGNSYRSYDNYPSYLNSSEPVRDMYREDRLRRDMNNWSNR